VDTKESIKWIIDNLTTQGSSVFSEKVYNVAAEFGIGEHMVKDCINQLIQENFVCEPMCGILRKV
jgi:hypothetical protein